MKYLLTCSLILISLTGLTQKTSFKLVKDVFYTTLENGNGKEVPMIFNLSDIDSIKSSKDYKEFLTDKDFINSWIKKGQKDVFAIYLMSKVNAARMLLKSSLTNSTSFTIEPNSKGMIFFSEEITITIPFSAQNGYGTMIRKKGYIKGIDVSLLD